MCQAGMLHEDSGQRPLELGKLRWFSLFLLLCEKTNLSGARDVSARERRLCRIKEELPPSLQSMRRVTT